MSLRGADFDQITFSPDGKHYAARFTTTQNAQYVFVDGKAGQEYQTVDHIAFTSDSAKVTYTAFASAKPYAVIGDQESNACSAQMMIAPAGGRAGTICGLSGGGPTVFIDGKTSPVPNGAESGGILRFSPDGQHYAYTAGFQGGGVRLVVDGAVQMNSNLKLVVASDKGGNFVFSPDSQHVAVYSNPPSPTGEYSTGLFLDGKYIPNASAPPFFYRLEFTADSKHVAWAQGVPSQHAFRIFIDGKAVAETEEALLDSSQAWWDMAPDGTLSVLGQDENNLKRITITPSPETSLATMGGHGITLAQTGK